MDPSIAATISVGLLAVGATLMVSQRRWLAICFYASAALAGAFLMETAFQRVVWSALALVSIGVLVLWEVQLRSRRDERVAALREKETEGRTLGLLLYMICAMGIPPNAARDHTSISTGWIDSARSLLRDVGGARFVDIFNSTAGVPVELPDPLADGTRQEQQLYTMVSRHLTKMRELIHEIETDVPVGPRKYVPSGDI